MWLTIGTIFLIAININSYYIHKNAKLARDIEQKNQLKAIYKKLRAIQKQGSPKCPSLGAEWLHLLYWLEGLTLNCELWLQLVPRSFMAAFVKAPTLQRTSAELHHHSARAPQQEGTECLTPAAQSKLPVYFP